MIATHLFEISCFMVVLGGKKLQEFRFKLAMALGKTVYSHFKPLLFDFTLCKWHEFYSNPLIVYTFFR